MKKKLLIAFKLVLTALVIWWVLHKLGPQGIKNLVHEARHCNPWGLAGGFIAMLGVVFLGVWRWQLLLRLQGIRITHYHAFWITAVGMFFNAFLIGSTGGDVFKAWFAAEAAGDKKPQAVLSIAVDRLIGLLGLFILASLAVLTHLPLLMSHDKTKPIAFFVLASCAFAIVVLGLTTQRHWITRQPWWDKLWQRLPAKELLNKLSQSYDLYAKYPGTLGLALLISLSLHVVGCAAAFSIGTALGVQGVNFGHYLLYCPLINAFAAVPITVSGLGLREGAYQFFFALQNVPEAQATALGFLYYIISLPVLSLVCGVFYVAGKPKSVALPSGGIHPSSATQGL